MTDYLYARPSFLEGVARNIDLFGSLNEYNKSVTPEEADLRGRDHDISALRKDMKVACEEVLDGDRH